LTETIKEASKEFFGSRKFAARVQLTIPLFRHFAKWEPSPARPIGANGCSSAPARSYAAGDSIKPAWMAARSFLVSIVEKFFLQQKPVNKITANHIRRRSIVHRGDILFTSALAEITSSKSFVLEKAPLRLQRSVAVPHSGAAPDDANIKQYTFRENPKRGHLRRALCIDCPQTCPSLRLQPDRCGKSVLCLALLSGASCSPSDISKKNAS
jgi:hypothetical protein